MMYSKTVTPSEDQPGLKIPKYVLNDEFVEQINGQLFSVYEQIPDYKDQSAHIDSVLKLAFEKTDTSKF